MSFPKRIIGLCVLWICLQVSAQGSGNAVSVAEIKQRLSHCDTLNFEEQTEKEIFLQCREAYAYDFDFRKALNVMQVAHRKFPYAYEIRANRAVALHEVGNSNKAIRELVGLIRLYPHKAELHNYLGRVQYKRDKVKAVMPLLLSVSIAPNAGHADENLVFIKRLLNIKKAKNKSIVNPIISVISDNDFHYANYYLIETHSSKQADDDALWLRSRIGDLCIALEKTPHQKSGFFWDFYGAYFIQLHQHNLIDKFVSKILNSNTFQEHQELSSLNKSFGIE